MIRQVDRKIHPATIAIISKEAWMIRNTQFVKSDGRLDDEVTREERRPIEPPPETCNVVTPFMTDQVEACNDFSPPPIDGYF